MNEPWLTWLAGEIDADPKAKRRGVSHVTVRPDEWELLGCPMAVKLATGQHVPITPTGRTPFRVSWWYRRRKVRR